MRGKIHLKLKAVFAGVAGSLLTIAGVSMVTMTARSEPHVIVKPADQAALPVLYQAPVDLAKKIGQLGVSAVFKEQGIKRHSTMKCTDRSKKGCTSYEGMRQGTVNGITAFRRASGCKLTVSGGTEVGHAKMRFSHGNGWKIDIMPNKCVDSYVHRTMRKVGERSDGSEMFRPRPGQLYADENGSHWDIFFGPEWCVKKLIKHERCE